MVKVIKGTLRCCDFRKNRKTRKIKNFDSRFFPFDNFFEFLDFVLKIATSQSTLKRMMPLQAISANRISGANPNEWHTNVCYTNICVNIYGISRVSSRIWFSRFLTL